MPFLRLSLSRVHRRSQHVRGFTLIELVMVIIIVGALAAIAVPRYIALGRDARVAAVKTLAGTVSSVAVNFHAMCRLAPNCDYNINYQPSVVIGGISYGAIYGWPNSGGQQPAATEIAGLVGHAGFTAINPTTDGTKFTLDGAPTPGTCSVYYPNTYNLGPAVIPVVTINTAGC